MIGDFVGELHTIIFHTAKTGNAMIVMKINIIPLITMQNNISQCVRCKY